MSIENIGTSPQASNIATEGAPGLPGAASAGTQQNASQQDTTGTAVAGIGAALPGGSIADVPPGGSSPSIGNESGTIDSGYGYGGSAFPSTGLGTGAPDTGAVYGGGVPSAFSPALGAGGGQGLLGSALDPGIIDTTIGGGAVHTDGTPPAFRAPSAFVAASWKDTSLTDILGNQLNAPNPVNQLAYAASVVDTSYFGAPAAPAPVSSQVDTISSIQSATPNYASQLGILPSTLVVQSLGQLISQTDTITLNHSTPAALSKNGITSAQAAIVVTDTTTSKVLVQGTDYTLAASGSGSSLTYTVTRVNASANSSDGDSANVTYQYGSANFFSQPVAVLTTDYTVTTGSNGPNTALYITRAGGSTVLVVGDTVTMTYQFGTPAYFDSNLPAPYSLTVTDTMSLTDYPQALSEDGITTAAASIAVTDTTNGNPLVLNTDYTLTAVYLPTNANTQSASLLGYQITRLLSSPSSQAGDTITVTYAFLTSIPGAPGMGALISQTDTITLNHSVPAALSKTGIVSTAAQLVVTDTTSGKLLALTTDYTVAASGSGATQTYTITRVNSSSNSSDSDSATVTYSYGNAFYFGSGPVTAENRGVVVNWTPPSGTVEVDFYMIQCSDLGTQYVPVTGAPLFYGQPAPSGGGMAGEPTFQSDTFTGGFSHSVPVTLSQQGIITPPGQVIVRDITDTSPGDPLQPGGTVLIYGVDYTITQQAIGPWVTYQVQRLASSVNSNDGDTIVVDYWWSNPATVQSVYTQGLLPNINPIYTPGGVIRTPPQGYQFRVAAGNRAGLGPFSGWSDFVSPANPNAYHGFVPSGAGNSNSFDPANAVNPVYRPDGTVKPGTGLGG